MKELLEKAKKLLKKVEKYRLLTEKYDNKTDTLKSKIWTELETKYELVFNKSKRRELEWKPSEFHYKVSLLIRSMVKRNKVVRFSNTEEDSFDFNLTQKYGLKRPHTWRAYSIMPYGTKSLKFENGMWETSQVKIPFSTLNFKKGIDSKKLKKLLYFLEKISRLHKSYLRIVEDFLPRFKNIEVLYVHSDLDKFIEALGNELKLKMYYNEYANRLEKFRVRQDLLLQEMKDYNKPFRILLVIKSSGNDD